jgi:hypothetical protein
VVCACLQSESLCAVQLPVRAAAALPPHETMLRVLTFRPTCHSALQWGHVRAGVQCGGVSIPVQAACLVSHRHDHHAAGHHDCRASQPAQALELASPERHADTATGWLLTMHLRSDHGLSSLQRSPAQGMWTAGAALYSQCVGNTCAATSVSATMRQAFIRHIHMMIHVWSASIVAVPVSLLCKQAWTSAV